MLLPHAVIWMFSGGLMVLAAGMVSGQDYPNKPIRIVTSGLGGGTDFVARLIAEGISGPLGQSVVVENRANITGAEIGASATPDGYTLVVQGQALWIGPLLQKLSYDPVKDFSPITLTDRSPGLLSVHPSLPVTSVKELIALAKAKPGQLNYASTAAGSAGHLAGELFKAMAGVNIVWVPYKSMAVAVTDLLSSRVQMMFTSPSPVAAHINSGRLKALAVATAQPSPLLPGLPTVAATGLPGYEAASITVVFAPAKTPASIINRLNRESVRVLSTEVAKKKIFSIGAEAVGSSPQEAAAAIKSDMAKYGKVIKDAGIKVD